MAENVDRHANSVMNFHSAFTTFIQRFGRKQMTNILSSRRHSHHLVAGGQTILATYRQTKDSLTITTFDCTERTDGLLSELCFRSLNHDHDSREMNN
jgi:hypothetical protein